MLRNLNISTKFSLLLLLIFLVVVAISGIVLSIILDRYAEQIVTDKALLLIETMGSVRNYTSNEVNPELASRLETEDQFLPQTIPAYSAFKVFDDLTKNNEEYNDFFYKEATLNPTNIKDKADEFETTVVEAFRDQPKLPEQTGFRSLPGGKIFYIARPISVSKQSCLRCHSTPEEAPKSQINTYGDQNGFGWKLDEIVGARMISVPASKVFENARNLKLLVIGILSLFLLGAILIINLFLRKTVTNPLQKMSKLAKQVSTGDMSVEFPHKANDEIGILAASLNRMKVSLQLAMNMLDSETKEKK